MVALAAVFVPVRLDMSGVAGQMSKGLNDAARGSGSAATAAGANHGRLFGRSFGTAGGAELERSTGSMSSRVGGAMSGLTGRFAQFGGIAVRGIGLATGAMGGLAIAGATMGIKTAASMEQAQIGFETLLGSGAKAQTFLTNLQTFAAATPFELPGLIDSSRLLLGVGVSAQDTMGILQAFGNASSAVGVGQENFQRIMLATSQAIGAGRFMTQDLNQITENGIPIWTVLSRAMGKPVPELRKLASAGKLMSDQVLPILEKQMNKDYGGAMERQSRSLSGVWSTFMDTLNIGLANVIRPLIPAMTVGLTGATNILSAALTAIPRVFSSAGSAGSAFGGIIRNLGTWVRRDLIPAYQALYARVFPALQGAVRSVASAFRDHQDAVQAIGQVFQALGFVFTRVVIPALGLLYVAMAATLGPMVRVLLTLVGAVATVVRAVVTGVPRIAGAITGAFTSSYAAVTGFVTGTYGAITGWVSGAARAVAGFGTSVRNSIVAGFRTAGAWLAGVGNAIIGGLLAAFNTIAPHLVIAAGHTRDGLVIAYRASVTWLVGAGRAVITGLINGLRAMFGPTATVIANFINTWVLRPWIRIGTALVGRGRELITGLLNGIRSVFGVVSATVSGFISRYMIGPWVRSAVWLVVSGRNVIAGLLNGARSLFATVSATVSGFISQRIVAPFGRAISWLVGSGRNVISGLLSGMGAVARGIGSWIQSNVVNRITGMFRNAYNFIYNGGYNIIRGLYSGITTALGNVRNWVSAHITTPIINGVKYFFGINSPSTVMAGVGGNLIAGLLQGLIRTNPVQFIGKIFGGMPQALGAIVSKGLVSLEGLPGKALDALGKVGGLISGLLGNITVPANVTGAKAIGRSMMSQIWPDSQWPSLYALWQGESGWNPLAHNPSSGAHGIPQSLPASKMASAGPNYMTDAATQIRWGLGYIRSVYGSPSNAYAKWLSRSPHWYDVGGWLPPGGVGMNATSRPERVLNPQESEQYARNGGRSGGDVRVHVYFDGTLVDDRVRVVVEDGFDTFGAMLDNQ